MSRSSRSAYRSVASLALAAAGLAAAAPGAGAQTALQPYVDCIAPWTPDRDHYTTYFGYVNLDPFTRVIFPNSPNNFFNPGHESEGGDNPLPSDFFPGWQPRVKAIVRRNSAGPVTWFLGSNSAVATPFEPFESTSQPVCGPYFTGNYRSTRDYVPEEIVYSDGASWIAEVASKGTPPPAEGIWSPFAAAGATGETGEAGATGDVGATGDAGPAGPEGESGERGPIGPAGPEGDPGAQGPMGLGGAAGATGAPGEAGETGAPGAGGATGAAGPNGTDGAPGPSGAAGPAGPEGASGPSDVTVASTRLRFDSNREGRTIVRDENVTRTSTIVLQYAHNGLRQRRPTNVSAVRDGQFVATGSPRARFTYVVHNTR